MNYGKFFSVVLLSVLFSACAYQPYDAKIPDEYTRYWCDPKNTRNSLAKIVTSEKGENIVNMPRDKRSEHECLRQHKLEDNPYPVPE